MRKVYVSEVMGRNGRARPLGQWKDRVKEYMCVRGTIRMGRF